MAPPVVGAVTIGQSPRTDVVPDIAGLLPPGTRVIERGALDHVGPAGLASLAPACGEDLLVTRLRDGTEVRLAEARITPLLQDAVDDVTGRGAAVVAALRRKDGCAKTCCAGAGPHGPAAGWAGW